jgi:hypothetical protein
MSPRLYSGNGVRGIAVYGEVSAPTVAVVRDTAVAICRDLGRVNNKSQLSILNYLSAY